MLTALRHLIEEIISAPDFREAMQAAVKRIAHILLTDACAIFLLDRHYNYYILIAAHGLNPKAVGTLHVPLHKGLVGLVGEREEPINLDRACDHPRFLSAAILQEEAYSSFLGVPIIYQRQVLGVLTVQRVVAKYYNESEEAFLVTLSARLGAMIAHSIATEGRSEGLPLFCSRWQVLTYSGISGAPGIGIGKGVVIAKPYDLEGIPDRGCDSVEEEIAMLDRALSAVRLDLLALSKRLSPMLSEEEQDLFDAYQRILESGHLHKELVDHIYAGNWASGALRRVIQAYVRRLEALENNHLRERAMDIKDLGQRILSYLQKSESITTQYYDQSILIGETLTATDLAQAPEGQLAGIISMTGSLNSHVAILARAMSIPTVMGARDIPMYELQHQEIIIDGYYGQIYVSPNTALRSEFERLATEEKKLNEQVDQLYYQPAMTQDGCRVGMMVNTGLSADISIALSVGAEGVGLYRTEIPFLMRDCFPAGEEQRVIYRQLLSSFSPRPVIIRTLDVGGDKPLPYFPIKEDNPFLGWRGMRITLDHPEIFLSQIRAMLRASEHLNNLRIIFPMITDANEVDEAKRLLYKAYMEVCEEGYNIIMPPIGVMIEVPSAVYQARALAKRVDFLSVGSNDLTQYLLAVDRNNSRVAALYDALHPAVLRALLQTVKSGHQEGKHVSICGEIAGDPVAVMALVAIGFDSLSTNASVMNRVKWIIHHISKKSATQLLHEVLEMDSAVRVRCHLELALERIGLGNLIRAGR